MESFLVIKSSTILWRVHSKRSTWLSALMSSTVSFRNFFLNIGKFIQRTHTLFKRASFCSQVSGASLGFAYMLSSVIPAAPSAFRMETCRSRTVLGMNQNRRDDRACSMWFPCQQEFGGKLDRRWTACLTSFSPGRSRTAFRFSSRVSGMSQNQGEDRKRKLWV